MHSKLIFLILCQIACSVITENDLYGIRFDRLLENPTTENDVVKIVPRSGKQIIAKITNLLQNVLGQNVRGVKRGPCLCRAK